MENFLIKRVELCHVFMSCVVNDSLLRFPKYTLGRHLLRFGIHEQNGTIVDQ